MLARSGDAFRAPVAVSTEDQPRHAPAKDAGGAPGLLCELVRRYLLLAQVPAADWSRNENALLMLSESILGSALAPSAAMSTEGAVAEAIKKRLASGGPDGVERALRFSKVLAELQGMFTSNRLWSILYFLLRLAEKSGRGSTTARMADILGSGSLVPTRAIIYSPAAAAKAVESSSLPMADRPQAEYWKDFRELCQKQTTIPELALLRDLVFVLQGGDGSLVQFDEVAGRFVLLPTLNAPVCVRALVERIAECGGLCRRILRLLTHSAGRASAIRQSFNQAMEMEMREYFKLVACFEATLSGDEASSMTMRRALVWFSEHQPHLAFLEALLREAQAVSGPELISLLHQYRTHGFPEIAAACERLLAESLRPFCAMVGEFVRFGNLLDPHDEFFITLKHRSATADSPDPVSAMDRFVLDQRRIPRLIPLEVAQQALLAGKTRAFLASLATDHMEIDNDEAAVAAAEATAGIPAMIELVRSEHQLACRQLAELLHGKYSIRTHLRAIRDFIHFARGDFASALMESLSGPLSRPAGSLFRHALVSSLDQVLIAACRGERDRHIRERMDVRIHETTNPKVTGWDVFTLDYKIDFPLNVIIGTADMTEHVRLSHFLWSLRRVHFLMNHCAGRIIALQRTLSRHRDLRHDLKRLQLFVMEGAVLTRQICEYSFTLVRQCWDRFLAKLDEVEPASTGLDFFVDAHRRLLEDLRASILVFYNGALKTKLALVLSDLLKSEGALKSFERYVALCLEHEHRRAPPATAPHHRGAGVSPEDEAILESFPTHQLRLLSEHRAGFQHCVRQFQANLDELLLQLQKESSSQEAGLLRAALDYNGYHSRRAGFDQAKYCAVPKQ